MANVFLDCDTGIDDALAIAYLKAHTDTNVVGVGIVAGNTTVEFGARNTIDLLAMLGDTTTPVAVGETRFYARPFHGGAVHVHGENGVGDVALPRCDRALADVSAAQLLVDLAHEYPHDLTVLAIGPLTNLALALEIDPSIASLVSEVVIMGGALLVPGNITSHAEANIHCDPEAAEVVFAADWPVTLVPLDVTTRHRFTQADIAELAAAPSAGVRSVAEMLVSYAGFYSTIYGERVALLHDPLAAAIAVGGVSVTESIEVPVAVNVSGGELQGRTSRYAALAGEVAVPRRAATVVLDVDVPLAPVLVEALTRQ